MATLSKNIGDNYIGVGILPLALNQLSVKIVDRINQRGSINKTFVGQPGREGSFLVLPQPTRAYMMRLLVTEAVLGRSPTMDRNISGDYRQFRILVRDYAEHMLKHFPQSAHKQWVVKCYCSMSAFEARFRTKRQREAILKELQHNRDVVEDAVNHCRPVFDAFQVESWPPPQRVGD